MNWFVQMNFVFLFSVVLNNSLLHAQFAPRAGEPGSTAIHKDSLIFTSWAISAQLNRGYQNISDTSLGKTTVGTEASVLGKAGENGVVSLGDGGSIVLEFNPPIQEGAGVDFAVFENGFFYKDSLDFLELAFVEVSSDGIHFFRFPAQSFTQSVIQVDTFDGLDARKINNLAGKYAYGFGTPFDLADLTDNPELNKNNIQFVRIIDVVGSIDSQFLCRDNNENAVNDPWPTPFPNGGFDLDAIGVIHSNALTRSGLESDAVNLIYPNPVQKGRQLFIISNELEGLIELVDFSGRSKIALQYHKGKVEIPEDLSEGIYFVKLGGQFLGKVSIH
jgi:hypothetical protein